MKKIKINLDNDVAERLEIAANILGVSIGELINEHLIGYQGKSGLFRGKNFDEVCNQLDASIERFIQEVCELKAKSGDLVTPKAESALGYKIQMSEAESLMLELVSRYQEKSKAEYFRECLLARIVHQFLFGVLIFRQIGGDYSRSHDFWLLQGKIETAPALNQSIFPLFLCLRA